MYLKRHIFQVQLCGAVMNSPYFTEVDSSLKNLRTEDKGEILMGE